MYSRKRREGRQVLNPKVYHSPEGVGYPTRSCHAPANPHLTGDGFRLPSPEKTKGEPRERVSPFRIDAEIEFSGRLVTRRRLAHSSAGIGNQLQKR